MMDPSTNPSVWAKIRILTVPTISAFLCFLFVVIKPLNKFGGNYAFLVYTALLLFFFPNEKIVPQIEATILGILGGVLGLLWSCVTLAIAAYCGRKYGSDSDVSRGVIGLGLALLSLTCGFLRSQHPSLTAASRIALFFPIFLLTASTSLTSMRWFYFTDHFYVTCFAAAFSLIPTLVLSRSTSSAHLGHLILDSIHITSELLPISLSSVLDGEKGESDPKAIPLNVKQGNQARMLKSRISQLQPVYDELILEINHGRAPPTALYPLIGSLKSLCRNPLLGPTSHVAGERIRSALDKQEDKSQALNSTQPGATGITARELPRTIARAVTSIVEDSASIGQTSARSSFNDSRFWGDDTQRKARHRPGSVTPQRPTLITASDQLVAAINGALQTSSVELIKIFQWQDPNLLPQGNSSSLSQIKSNLELALSELQRRLTSLLDGLEDSANATPRTRPSTPVGNRNEVFSEIDLSHDRDHFRLAFNMTALLDLAKDVVNLLVVVISITNQASQHNVWYFPRIPWLSLERLGVGSNPTNRDEIGDIGDDEGNEDVNDPQSKERVFDETDFVTAKLHQGRRTTLHSETAWDRVENAWKRVWDHKSVILGRVVLSKLLHELRHSRHVLFSIKLAGGISLLSLPAFLPPGAPGKKWFESSRCAWTVISYMYVLEVHTGATLKVGFFRLLGTFIGALAAFVFTLIAHDNPYALVTLATVASIPLSYLILLSPYPQIGTVAGITLPPLLFLSYLDLADGQSSWHLAWTRFVDITIGIVAAVLVGSLIWPNHARVRYFRAVSRTFDRESDYYLHMSRDLLRPSLVYQNNPQEYNKLEADVRRHLQMSRTLIDLQRKELSLLPRPIKLYSEVVDAAERLFETFSEIRILRFSVPRKTTVLDAMPLRRELISSVLVNLWALSQAFRSRSSLPQYLPSPRIPLEGVMGIVEELARSSRNQRDGVEGGKDGLAILYAMAENEAIGEACDVLEELVTAARLLFGTRKFLDSSQDVQGIMGV